MNAPTLVNTVIKVDENIKKEFQKICKRNGVKPAEALKDFINYVVTSQSYPFKRTLTTEKNKNE